jgi:hypothetical protein
LTVGFVGFIGSTGNLRSKSLQFHLPLQFFLPLTWPKSGLHVKTAFPVGSGSVAAPK